MYGIPFLLFLWGKSTLSLSSPKHCTYVRTQWFILVGPAKHLRIIYPSLAWVRGHNVGDSTLQQSVQYPPPSPPLLPTVTIGPPVIFFLSCLEKEYNSTLGFKCHFTYWFRFFLKEVKNLQHCKRFVFVKCNWLKRPCILRHNIVKRIRVNNFHQ